MIKMTSSSTKHDVFQAIADPTRRALLSLLSEQELPVNMICSYFPMTRTAVSKHLKILEEAGLLRETKKGRETHYKLQAEGLKELKDWLSYYERFWDHKLFALKDFIENKNEME